VIPGLVIPAETLAHAEALANATRRIHLAAKEAREAQARPEEGSEITTMEIPPEVEALPPVLRRLWIELAKSGEAPMPPADDREESDHGS